MNPLDFLRALGDELLQSFSFFSTTREKKQEENPDEKLDLSGSPEREPQKAQTEIVPPLSVQKDQETRKEVQAQPQKPKPSPVPFAPPGVLSNYTPQITNAVRGAANIHPNPNLRFAPRPSRPSTPTQSRIQRAQVNPAARPQKQILQSTSATLDRISQRGVKTDSSALSAANSLGTGGRAQISQPGAPTSAGRKGTRNIRDLLNAEAGIAAAGTGFGLGGDLTPQAQSGPTGVDQVTTGDIPGQSVQGSTQPGKSGEDLINQIAEGKKEEQETQTQESPGTGLEVTADGLKDEELIQEPTPDEEGQTGVRFGAGRDSHAPIRTGARSLRLKDASGFGGMTGGDTGGSDGGFGGENQSNTAFPSFMPPMSPGRSVPRREPSADPGSQGGSGSNGGDQAEDPNQPSSQNARSSQRPFRRPRGNNFNRERDDRAQRRNQDGQGGGSGGSGRGRARRNEPTAPAQPVAQGAGGVQKGKGCANKAQGCKPVGCMMKPFTALTGSATCGLAIVVFLLIVIAIIIVVILLSVINGSVNQTLKNQNLKGTSAAFFNYFAVSKGKYDKSILGAKYASSLSDFPVMEKDVAGNIISLRIIFAFDMKSKAEYSRDYCGDPDCNELIVRNLALKTSLTLPKDKFDYDARLVPDLLTRPKEFSAIDGGVAFSWSPAQACAPGGLIGLGGVECEGEELMMLSIQFKEPIPVSQLAPGGPYVQVAFGGDIIAEQIIDGELIPLNIPIEPYLCRQFNLTIDPAADNFDTPCQSADQVSGGPTPVGGFACPFKQDKEKGIILRCTNGYHPKAFIYNGSEIAKHEAGDYQVRDGNGAGTQRGIDPIKDPGFILSPINGRIKISNNADPDRCGGMVTVSTNSDVYVFAHINIDPILRSRIILGGGEIDILQGEPMGSYFNTTGTQRFRSNNQVCWTGPHSHFEHKPKSTGIGQDTLPLIEKACAISGSPILKNQLCIIK